MGAGVTGPEEAETLPAHGEAVVERRQKQRYRAQLGRRSSRPTGNGQERP